METPVILSAVRTPIGKFQGGLAGFSAPELGGKVVAEAARRASSMRSRACTKRKSVARFFSPRERPMRNGRPS